MAREPDEELKKAFSQLHEKIDDTTRELKVADIHIEKLRRIIQRGELTAQEITSYPENTRIYAPVGRMFLLSDINNIKAGIDKSVTFIDDKVKTLENKKSYLQQNLKEFENNVREMIQQKKNKETSG